MNSRIVLLTSTYPFGTGEEFIEAEIGYLASAFSEVVVVPIAHRASTEQTRQVPEGVRVVTPREFNDGGSRFLLRFALRHPVCAARALWRSLGAGPNLRGVLKDFEFDLLAHFTATRLFDSLKELQYSKMPTVFYSYWLHMTARVALILRDQLGLECSPVVSRAHRSDLYEEAHPTKHLPQRAYLYRHLSKIYSVSSHGTQYLQKRSPHNATKIVTARLGVSAADNPGNPTQLPFRVVSCSYATAVKRIPLLVEGLAELQRLGLKLHWTHIGDGPQFEQLRKVATSQLVSGSFEFAGRLTNSEVRKWHATHPCSVFINVSASEGVPVSIMEALAQGLPVIATDVGGSGELIHPPGGMFAGLLPADPGATEIAAKLMHLAQAHTDDYDNYVQASQRHWKEHWSDSNFVLFCDELQRLV